MKVSRKERERIISLYMVDRKIFSEEKTSLIEEKLKLEEKEYSYDSSDPSLYDVLDELAEKVYQLTLAIGLYYWVEDNFKRDERSKIRSSSESPSKIINRWNNRDLIRLERKSA